MTTLLKSTQINYTPGSAGLPGTPGTPGVPARSVTVVDYIIPGKPIIPATVSFYYYDTGIFNPRLVSPNQFGNFNDVGVRTVKISAYGGTPSTVVYKTITSPGVPAIPPTPSVAPTEGKTFSDFNFGWNTGGIGRLVLAADMVFRFTVPASVIGVVTGLNDYNAGSSYQEIKFGIYFSHGRAIVFESGVQKGSEVLFADTDVFRIKRVGGVVTYSLNDVVFYTNAGTVAGLSAGPLFVDSSLYAGGDAISSASFAALPSLSGGRARLHAVAAFGATRPYAAGVAVFPAFTSKAGAYGRAESRSKLSALVSVGSDRPYAAGAAALQTLTTVGQQGQLTPSYAVAASTLAYVISASRILSGEMISSRASNQLKPLAAFGADHNYAAGSGVLAQVGAFGAEGTIVDGLLLATLRAPFTFLASGTEQTLAGVDATLPMPTLVSFSGTGLASNMPSPKVAISGKFGIVGRVMAKMPSALAAISGTTGAIGFVSAALSSKFTVSSYSGSVVAGSLAKEFTAFIGGSADGQGAVYARMPLFVVDARGSEDSIARIMAAMPMIVAVPSAILRALAPSFSVVAEGHIDVQAAHEAYAVNLLVGPDQPHQVTRYTNFPFNQIVRHGDKYYGVSATGLFLLGGDTDIDAPIPWAIKTGKTDFGEAQKKTVVSAYIGGSITEGAIVSVITGERENLDYDYPVPASATDQNWRVKFGRGLKTRYFAMSLADTNGGAFSADTIDLEIDNHKRRL